MLTCIYPNDPSADAGEQVSAADDRGKKRAGEETSEPKVTKKRKVRQTKITDVRPLAQLAPGSGIPKPKAKLVSRA